MDEENRPEKFWARILFQPRQLTDAEWRLGLSVVGIALFLTWLIYWTFIPRLIADTLLGIGSLIGWIIGLFSGSGANEAAPVLTPVPDLVPTALPSPSPALLPSPSPSPSPFPR
jgi:hypothetical protein